MFNLNISSVHIIQCSQLILTFFSDIEYIHSTTKITYLNCIYNKPNVTKSTKVYTYYTVSLSGKQDLMHCAFFLKYSNMFNLIISSVHIIQCSQLILTFFSDIEYIHSTTKITYLNCIYNKPNVPKSSKVYTYYTVSLSRHI